jgi:sugar phosphate isomerase/epimerase
MHGLSINHYIAPTGYPLERFFDDCADSGATGVGLTERALDEMPVATIKEHLSKRKLAVTSVNSAGFFLWDAPEKSRKQREVNAFLIDASSALEASALTTIGGGLTDAGEPSGTSLKTLRDRVVKSLPSLIDDANMKGVRLGVEPMHPSRMPNKSLLNTLSQTEALLSRFGDLTVMLDAFHTWWEPDLDSFIQRHASRISCVQLSGVRLSENPAMAPSRCPMREGCFDAGGMISLLRENGYDGPFEFELFSHELDGREVSDVVRQAVADFTNLSSAGAE